MLTVPSQLFPVLLAHSADEGRGRNFDMQGIADNVCQIFRGKAPISVQIRHFIYTGELQRIGLLTKLANVVEQVGECIVWWRGFFANAS